MMGDPGFFTLSECARLLRGRESSSVELTTALLERIARLDGELNAILLVTADTALAAARQADAEIARGNYRGAMHGVPYAAKDIFDVAGLPTTCHSKILEGNIVSANAAVITRLNEAGAVLIGKTSLHEFATGGPSLDLPWPPVANSCRDVLPISTAPASLRLSLIHI